MVEGVWPVGCWWLSGLGGVWSEGVNGRGVVGNWSEGVSVLSGVGVWSRGGVGGGDSEPRDG